VIRVEVTRESDGPLDAVWDLLARAESWAEWSFVRSAELEREGDPAPYGVGAIKRLGGGGRSSREEIVAFEPPTHLGYVILSGLPVRDYRSDVTLSELAGGRTRIHGRSRFETSHAATGWFWQAFVALTLRTFARQLAKAAAKR
jgi:hypothetical protein